MSQRRGLTPPGTCPAVSGLLCGPEGTGSGREGESHRLPIERQLSLSTKLASSHEKVSFTYENWQASKDIGS